jgi:outer membrane immunogenic protein
MKRISLPLVLVSMFAVSSAFGADIPPPVFKAPVIAPPVPFTWGGFYGGGFGGGSFGSEDPVDMNEYGFQTIPGIPRSGSFHIWRYDQKASVIGGGTLGFNFQTGNFVFGIEGEGGYIHSTGSGRDANSPGQDVLSTAVLGDWYAIVAGRVGYAMDRTLIYAKGGAVFTRERGNITDNCIGNGTPAAPCGPVTIVANGSNNEVAPVFGGGIEYAFTNNWSGKFEYLYWGLNDHFLVTGVASNGATYSWDHSFSGLHTVKFGINYSFRP